MTQVMLRIWRFLRGPLQWRALYLFHAKFMVGVTGACWDESGRILLLKHRFWPEDQPWGLPSGYAKREEELENTLRRELNEETGYELKDVSFLRVTGGYRLRIEVLGQGWVVGGPASIDTREVLEAKFFELDHLPTGLLASHREMIEFAAARQDSSSK